MPEQIIYNEFLRIKEMGWIKSDRRGPTGIGKTFENLIDIKENSLSYPDYFGIEIKTRRKNLGYHTTLFSLTPKGEHEYETYYLRDTYGYPDKKDRNLKVLNVSLYGNKYCDVGLSYKAQLFVNRHTKVINLLIYDKYKILLEGTTYWSFEKVRDSLFTKCSMLALIEADHKVVRGEEYFQFKSIAIYKIKDFDTFLALIERGIVRITLKVSVYRSGIRKGQTHDHGTGFEILAENLELLYDKVL